ncbi:MAG: DoxX family protein [Chitinophagaceae bacterium]|nr:DoxX family protein [Chitinophagaceae bacterium]
MKKLMSIGYSDSAFNIALFLLRVGGGLLILVAHGYVKFEKFSSISPEFANFLGMGSSVSLSLSIFAELICAALVILGLFTRLACIPLVINMSVAIAVGHQYDVFGAGEKPSLFLLIFLTILLVGPGKFSVDGLKN